MKLILMHYGHGTLITREFTEMIYHDPDYDHFSSRCRGQEQSECGLITHAWLSSIGFSYEAAKTKKVYFDNYFASVEKSLAGAFPGYEISIADWSKDLTKFVVYAGNETRSRWSCTSLMSLKDL